MRRFFYIFTAGALPLASCAPVGPPPPSLAPRAAEGIDPRLPVVPATSPRPVDPALSAQLAALIGQARAGDGEFSGTMAAAERLANAAGPRQSESWVVAQQALSAASAARVATTRALADVDAMAAAALQSQGTIAPADLSAIQAAAAAVAEIDRRQAARISAVSRKLGV